MATDAELHFGPISRIGGSDCLDFVNTLHWRGTERPIERLTEYEDLVAWASYGNFVDTSQAARLRVLAQNEAAEAAGVLQQAWTLREALHRIIAAEMQRVEPCHAGTHEAFDLADRHSFRPRGVIDVADDESAQDEEQIHKEVAAI